MGKNEKCARRRRKIQKGAGRLNHVLEQGAGKRQKSGFFMEDGLQGFFPGEGSLNFFSSIFSGPPPDHQSSSPQLLVPHPIHNEFPFSSDVHMKRRMTDLICTSTHGRELKKRGVSGAVGQSPVPFYLIVTGGTDPIRTRSTNSEKTRPSCVREVSLTTGAGGLKNWAKLTPLFLRSPLSQVVEIL